MRNGRVVVITEAVGGIGSKVVDRFLVNGDTVVGLDRSEPALGSHADVGTKLFVVHCDITHEADVSTTDGISAQRSSRSAHQGSSRSTRNQKRRTAAGPSRPRVPLVIARDRFRVRQLLVVDGGKVKH